MGRPRLAMPHWPRQVPPFVSLSTYLLKAVHICIINNYCILICFSMPCSKCRNLPFVLTLQYQSALPKLPQVNESLVFFESPPGCQHGLQIKA